MLSTIGCCGYWNNGSYRAKEGTKFCTHHKDYQGELQEVCEVAPRKRTSQPRTTTNSKKKKEKEEDVESKAMLRLLLRETEMILNPDKFDSEVDLKDINGGEEEKILVKAPVVGKNKKRKEARTKKFTKQELEILEIPIEELETPKVEQKRVVRTLPPLPKREVELPEEKVELPKEEEKKEVKTLPSLPKREKMDLEEDWHGLMQREGGLARRIRLY